MNTPPVFITKDYSSTFLKAKDKDIFVVAKSHPSQFPNLYITNNFIDYISVTNLHPEDKYNWFETSVLKWKDSLGQNHRGLLYKPEDFNPTKKYPVIISFYPGDSPTVSQNLVNGGHLGAPPSFNIAYLVTKGYLVFVPSIILGQSTGGQASTENIISTALYLKTLPYIAPNKMALFGHSFGGYAVNTIITKTKVFCAAIESAGVSDLISSYLSPSLGKDLNSTQPNYFENNQQNIKFTPWERKDLYLDYSPVLEANNVTTPILMVHNKTDETVPFIQGYEFFTALRRLGKRAWMFQYDYAANGHGFGLDFELRIKQFLDHYLKDAPAPIWMTKGIPARLKGIEMGFGLDSVGKTPPLEPLKINR